MSYIAKLKQLDLEKITNSGLKSVIQKNIEQFDESKATDKGKEQIKLMYELVEKKFPDAIKKEVEPKKEEPKKEEKTEPKAEKREVNKKSAPVKKEAPKSKAKPEPKKEDDKTVKISSINPKDKAEDVKEILEKEHYKVIVRKVGNKTTKVKIKRTDSQVAKEKVKSAFATITKSANSDSEKKELKSELQKVAEIRRQVITIIGNTYSAFKHGDGKQLDAILGRVNKFGEGGEMEPINE